MTLKQVRDAINEEMRSASMGLVVGIVLCAASVSFVQKVIGWTGFWGYVAAAPFIGAMLLIWWGCAIAIDFFRQATRFSDDERSGNDE